MVPGRDPDHAARLLLRAQRGELVQHSARLERAGLLEELGLQPDLVAERARGERRRPVDAAADPLRRSEHVVAGHRHRAHRRLRPVHDHPDTSIASSTTISRRSRLTVFFRLLLAIPHFIWFGLWSIARHLRRDRGWFVALVTRPPARRGCTTSSRRTSATRHISPRTSRSPRTRTRASRAQPGYPVDVEIAGAAAPVRWKTRCGSCSRSRRCCSRPRSAGSSAAGAVAAPRRRRGGGCSSGSAASSPSARSSAGSQRSSLGRMPHGPARPRRLRARLHGSGVRLRAAAHRPLPELRSGRDRPGVEPAAASRPARAQRRRPTLAADRLLPARCSRCRTSSGWRSGPSRRSWPRS